ncbi:MAG: hypothetical protein UT19_C0012G0014 [Candidatus Woesebacteria bacterium GW2011_GWB1_39_10b]|uniref:Uncharacterized protein n=2 Tax=Candidatus Woeseibacteriota TaxID=1752722 RepID=A0A0G0NDA0_9BACT|nr:MAG: hypothetical protein US72_C0013G0023 [Microgenomates group bacterium GW2011_GWC1_38_12]KKQ93425.1 MAG: hypothetical protein UT19_C0012G0014 [Candidatus Woesebacteria bacterium GW2011_GWB1_39_10b]KKR13483.1 MAG: hypothetical protein UT40_C0016G0014 [Candidatus Woesebacteria bacterium GW2011_GWA1_39_21b]
MEVRLLSSAQGLFNQLSLVIIMPYPDFEPKIPSNATHGKLTRPGIFIKADPASLEENIDNPTIELVNKVSAPFDDMVTALFSMLNNKRS